MTVTHKEAKQAETVSVEAVVGNITHAMGMLRMTLAQKQVKQAETVSVEAGMGNITHTMGMLRMTLAQKHAKQAETVSVEAHQHHAFNIMHSTSYAYKRQTPRSAKVGGA